MLVILSAIVGINLSLREPQIGQPPKYWQDKITDVINETVEIDSSTTVIFGGDVMLGRNVMATIQQNKDLTRPFKNISSIIKDADIAFINLESPIVDNCPTTVKGFTFCTTPEIASGIIDSGINIVNLANNHISNYGETGIRSTVDFLKSKNVLYTGFNNLAVKVHGGVKFGFLGFDFVFKDPKPEDFDLVSSSDGKVDVLFVSIHWGDEYQRKANAFQRQLAQKMVKLGADLIIGHHPHWVQNVDYFDKETFTSCTLTKSPECVPVYYSLGNLIFDQMWSEETRKGMMVSLKFDRSKITEEKFIHTYIQEVGQPGIVK